MNRRPGKAPRPVGHWAAYLFITPALVLTVGVVIPFAYGIYYSLTNYSFQVPTYKFIGLRNYTELLSSGTFWHSFTVTIVYGVLATAIEMMLGMAVALVLEMKSNHVTKLLRLWYVLPLMVSPAIAVLIWSLLTNTGYGLYAKFVSNALHIHGFVWAASPRTAMITALIIDAWVYTPFVIILVSAGLNSLPSSPYEAAELDGGGFWFVFRRLTLPMLAPVLLIALLFRLMIAIQEFPIIYTLTAGGPGNTLMNLPNLAYQEGFLYYQFGKAMAYLMVLWVIVYLVSFGLVRWYGKIQAKAATG